MAGERKGRDPYIPKDLAQRQGYRENQRTSWRGDAYEDLLRISENFTQRFASQFSLDVSDRYNKDVQSQLYVAGNMYMRLHTCAALRDISETKRISHVLQKIETFEGMAEFGTELLESTDFNDKAAGAGMLYLAAKRPEFVGEARNTLLRQATELFGLPKDTLRKWAFDGNKDYPDSAWGQEEMQNLNFAALCNLEIERPGAGTTLWNSPFRLISFGKFDHQHLIDQYDIYLEMIDPTRKQPLELPKAGLSLVASGENDWNGSGYYKQDGQTGSEILSELFDSYSYRTRPFLVEFARVSQLVDVISFLAHVYGLPQNGEFGSFIHAIGIQAHGGMESISPARPEEGLRRKITVDTLSRYPEEVFRLAEKIGLKLVVVTGCESGSENRFVQRVSSKIHGPLFIGTERKTGLSAAWQEEITRESRVEFITQTGEILENPPVYKNGQRVRDYYG